MTGIEISNLIKVGATSMVRKKLKKLGIQDRLKVLLNCMPYIKVTTENLNFFRENFSIEIGAIIEANKDLTEAEQLYRTSYK